MINFNEAYAIVMENAAALAAEEVDIDESLGRVLAEDIVSDMEFPPFNKAAMDGYACRVSDLACELEVIETIPAGVKPKKNIKKNTCSKIMTGAMVPEGANIVIKIEDVSATNKNTINVLHKDISRKNICTKGEDIKTGEKVLSCGVTLAPKHIGVLASVGKVRIMVAKKPMLGILSTGDEIIEPRKKPLESQIRDSNGCQLYLQAAQMSVGAKFFGIAKDTKTDLYALINQALEVSDVIILSGGVSMGDFDFVLTVMHDLGFNILFNKVATKPGKPMTFGVKSDSTGARKYFFGLPGNPMSVYLNFDIYIKPFLLKLMGSEFVPYNIMAPVEADVTRKHTERQEVVLVTFTKEGKLKKLDHHGSANFQVLTNAHGYFYFPRGESLIKKGSMVNVRLI